MVPSRHETQQAAGRTLRPNGNPEIGPRKVITFEEQRLISELRQRVAEAVAEIQRCDMAASLTILSVRGDGEGRLITREWHYLDLEIIEEAIQFLLPFGPDLANITIAVSR